MNVYYNEFDPYPAQWLRNLMKAGLIPEGDVDERSITDVQSDDVRGYDQCHFFAGIGGWPYALSLAGWEGQVWTGSCPCQPFSAAGRNGGVLDERHLWPAFRRLIAERRPTACFGEQVASQAGRNWLAGIRLDLEALGYAVGAADLCAASIGAPHIRQRLYWVATADDWSERRYGKQPQAVSGKSGFSWCEDVRGIEDLFDRSSIPQPLIRSYRDGFPEGVAQVKGFGNAIVPGLAAEFIGAFMDCRP